ncbi:MAG: sigma-70 family RNA polymerase sigma factor [Acidobacteria bacterium]|nr:sigma-70 family RNA polymerase sigma factor [Acidobacteriota bacterium]
MAAPPSVLEHLVQANGAFYLRLALKYLKDPDRAVDCLQEGYQKFLDQPGAPEGPTEAGRFLVRLLINHFIDCLRRGITARKHEGGGSDDIDGYADQCADGPETRFMERQREAFKTWAISRLVERLDKLSPPQRQLLQLVFFRKPPLTLVEISRQKNIPMSTVHSRLRGALRALRGICGDLAREWKKM